MIEILIIIGLLLLISIIWLYFYLRKIDFEKKQYWAFWPEKDDKPVDCFLICPTVEKGLGGNFFADPQNPKYRKHFVGALNQMKEIYSKDCNIYAPYYRQTSFHAISKKDYESYMTLAFGDVYRAFETYLKQSPPDRPILLAGFSQGSAMAEGLAGYFMSKPEYAKRFVACYAIGWRLNDDLMKLYPALKPAQGETDTGVIIAYNTEDESVQHSLMVPEGTTTYAINPLNWKTDSTPAAASLNKGFCLVGFDGVLESETPAFCGAHLDPVRGTLKVSVSDMEKYSHAFFGPGIYHLYDFKFFYRNLQENVTKRINAYMDQLMEG